MESSCTYNGKGKYVSLGVVAHCGIGSHSTQGKWCAWMYSAKGK